MDPMDRKAAKELLHIQGWLECVDGIIERGRDGYLADDLLQEAGDSLMMRRPPGRPEPSHSADRVRHACWPSAIGASCPVLGA
jgi:hypothetical protein